jgi:hypothetical protein
MPLAPKILQVKLICFEIFVSGKLVVTCIVSLPQKAVSRQNPSKSTICLKIFVIGKLVGAFCFLKGTYSRKKVCDNIALNYSLGLN